MENIIVGVTLLICLVTDLKERKIYNKVLLPALIIGIGMNIWKNGLIGLKISGFGFLLGLFFLIIPFIYGGIGAGDVKLLATIGAIKGPKFIFYTFLATGITGGIIALAILVYRKKVFRTLKNIFLGLKLMIISKFKIISFIGDEEKYMFPYGVAISIGAMLAFCILGA